MRATRPSAGAGRRAKPERLAALRRAYAEKLGAASKSKDPRLREVFESVPRETFVPPGPWRVYRDGRYFQTPDADPAHLYQNVLVALDASKGINNGEPVLHAVWLGAVAPQPGEAVCHVGAGTGYYTAILSRMVSPGGSVVAFEIETELADQTRKNLASFGGVTVRSGDATAAPMPPADLIYVNAGVTAPPVRWLKALRPGGRMICPWRPAEDIGLALILKRADSGFRVEPLITAWFIPCIGASGDAGCVRVPDGVEAWSTRSAWLTADRPPDGTAVAIYPDMWFSSAELT